MRKFFKYITAFSILLLCMAQPVFAGGPPPPSIFSSPLALTFIILMLLLLIVIGILANILIGAADIKSDQQKKERAAKKAAAGLMAMFVLFSSSLQAQDNATGGATEKVAKSIGGMEASTFYIMVGVLVVELGVILGLLMNIKLLLRKEKLRQVTEEEKAVAAEEKANRLSWWDKLNKFKPVSQEAELDLGHEYDGIRELNNRLPPWWLYGFYVSIIFAAVYLWRFHVSHEGPSSKEEYEYAVAKAEQRVQEYLKMKGENVDENTVTLLTDAGDLAAGKKTFEKCAACHGPAGGGTIGPNLTDDYWLYGGGIKDIFKTIKNGAPSTKGMVAWKEMLTPKEIAEVASYIKSLHGTNPPGGKIKEGELYQEAVASAAPADTAVKQ